MIKIRLEKWEKAVVMQVLEIDESLRGSDEIWEHESMLLKSRNFPELTFNVVYVRGKHINNDIEVIVRHFSNNTKRDEYYNKVVELFNSYNNRGKEDSKVENNIFILE